MNKYKEAMKVYEEVCKREGYDYRGTMGEDLGLDEIKPIFQELVDRFSDFIPTLDALIELTVKNLAHAYSSDRHYYQGVLDTLEKLKQGIEDTK